MRSVRPVFLEALLVGGMGLLIALAANALSPRGLRLSRNYFPDLRVASTNSSTAATHAATNGSLTTGTNATADPTILRLQQRGLNLATSSEAFELFRDPRYEQGLIVFVDARDDEHYATGHIPRAWQLNHYRPEGYLPVVLPACLGAMKVVVYCNGGQCDDSEFAAVMLREAGVASDNLLVYVGGITDWTAQGRPVESGARGSGQFVTSKATP
jgi:rhodanese-related sulfurtransferase